MLSYHDVILYPEDVALLQGPRWLNDQIVAFYYEYLVHEMEVPSRVTLLSGAQAFLMMNGERSDVEMSLVKPLGLKERDVIFLPVNDNPDVEMAEGGMHWSLLIWDRKRNAFLHLDSCGRTNIGPARKLAMKLFAAMGMDGAIQLIEPSVPQQRNAYDCALYVLKFSRILSTRLDAWTPERLEILESVTPEEVTQFRRELLDLINEKLKCIKR